MLNFFGSDNVFEITKEEMYNMMSNVFSISPTVVVSERNFTRLNNWLREQRFYGRRNCLCGDSQTGRSFTM